MANKDLFQLARELENFQTQGLSEELKRACFRIGSILEVQTKLFIRNNPMKKRAFGGSKQGLVKDGALLNSIKHSTKMNSRNSATVTIGSYGVPYAAIHEFGGTIRAKGGGLTIPFNTKAQGLRARNYPGKLMRIGRVLVDTELLKQLKVKGSNKIPRDAIAYLYPESVEIPARPYLKLAIERSEAKINQILQELKVTP